MVSTRQMTTGNNGSVENYQPPAEGSAKCTTRNTGVVLAAGFSGNLQYYKTTPTSVQSPHFLDLPQEIIEKIFGYLKFKNICQLRLVCRDMDRICGQILNSTFLRLQNQMLTRFQEIKSKMPRRESARRSHHLACESDIIETLHMRLTLLQMSFGKHIERKHICFFPGDILDEVYQILHYIEVTSKLDLPYKVTDELFDLSTMAMEYFKEKIEPYLPEIAYFSADFLNFSNFPNSTALSTEVSKDNGQASTDELEGDDLVDPIPQSNMVLRKRIRKIKQGMKLYNSQLSLLRQDLRSCKRKTCEQQKQISEQQKQLADQQKQTLEYATRLDEYDKKNEEISRKFSALLQELNKCKTELQYWRCKSPAMSPSCHHCGAMILPRPEELQPLINQGVMPENIGLVGLVDAVPPVSLEINAVIHQASGSNLEIIPQIEEIADLKEGKEDEIVPPSDELSTSTEVSKNKRKPEEAKEERPTKKTRRLSKIRSKRSKV